MGAGIDIIGLFFLYFVQEKFDDVVDGFCVTEDLGDGGGFADRSPVFLYGDVDVGVLDAAEL